MNRDDLHNELTGTKLVDDIEKTVDWVNAEESICALIDTGAAKAFSSGGNVKHMLNREGAQRAAQDRSATLRTALARAFHTLMKAYPAFAK